MRDYSIADFPEINCKKVIDLTFSAVDLYKNKLNYEDSLIDFNKFHRILCLELNTNSKEDVLSGIKKLEKRKEVLSAEPSFPYQIMTIPDDTEVSNQWGLTNVCAFNSWNIVQNASQVLVGIIDTGIDSTHSDLTNNIYRASPHNLTTTLHRDFTNGTESGVSILDPSDSNGHGTHVAGIIGAEGNNTLGIAGVCWNVKLVSLRVAGSSGLCSLESIANAISYAGSKNIPILNCSIGSGSNSQALRNAIDSYSGLIVCAAGNSGVNIDNNPVYPASYDFDNIIAVGAIDSSNNRSIWNGLNNLWGLLNGSSSNYGDVSVDIYAPGTDVLSTIPSNNYSSESGTSMSAPFVTGAAALLLAANNTLTTAQLKSTIIDGASQINITVPGSGCGGNITKSVLKLNIFESMKLIAFQTNSSGDTITGTWFNINDSIIIPSLINNTIISSIGQSAFKDCTTLLSVTIPNGVESIGNEAFKNCSNLDEVIVNKANLPLTTLGSSVFSGCSSSLQIKVPNDRIADYKNMTNWSTYSNKIIPYTNDFTTINMSSSTNTTQTLTLDAGYNKLYKLNVVDQGTYDVRASTSANTTIKLYDSNYNLLETKSKLLTKTLSTGIYYVSIAYQSNTQSGTLYPLFKVHSGHSYDDHYQWTSLTNHKSYCSCGNYINDFHVVSPDAYQNGNQYAICLLCNGFASVGGTWHDGIGSFPYTLNGSFILPNGVIVLEEADMEAYLNGTLVFIYPNDGIARSSVTPYLKKKSKNHLID